MRYYLVFVYDDVDPKIIGPFPSEELRDDKAIGLREEYGKNHGLFKLEISDRKKPTINAYSGGFFMEEEE